MAASLLHFSVVLLAAVSPVAAISDFNIRARADQIAHHKAQQNAPAQPLLSDEAMRLLAEKDADALLQKEELDWAKGYASQMDAESEADALLQQELMKINEQQRAFASAIEAKQKVNTSNNEEDTDPKAKVERLQAEKLQMHAKMQAKDSPAFPKDAVHPPAPDLSHDRFYDRVTFVCADDEDHMKQCPEWADEGMCETDPTIMHEMCKKSCGLCPDCHDEWKECSMWSGSSMCENNKNVAAKCRQSCNLCKVKKDEGENLGQPATSKDRASTKSGLVSSGEPRDTKQTGGNVQQVGGAHSDATETQRDSDVEVKPNAGLGIQQESNVTLMQNTTEDLETEPDSKESISALEHRTDPQAGTAPETSKQEDNEDSGYFWPLFALTNVVIISVVIYRNISYDEGPIEYGKEDFNWMSYISFISNSISGPSADKEYTGEDFRHMELGLTKDRSSWTGMIGRATPLHEAKELMGFSNMG